MKQQIEIQSVVEKKTVKGQIFLSVRTDLGSMSVFEGTVMGSVKQGLGKLCEVETEVNGNFTNITAFYQIIGDAPARTGFADGTSVLPKRSNDIQEKISSQWAINAAIKIIEIQTEIKFGKEELLPTIKEIAIKLKEMSKEI